MPSAINILVVENDQSTALDIEMLLENAGFTNVTVVDSAIRAMNYLSEVQPDLAILDIYIRGKKTGIELAEDISQRNIDVIFVTAYSKEDLYEAAKELTPVAYLIKPFNPITFRSTIDGWYHRYTKNHDHKNDLASIDENPQQLFIRHKGQLLAIDFKEINYIKSEGNYCYIYTLEGKKYMIKKALARVLALLPEAAFIQVHRSFVVRIDQIKKVALSAGQLWLGEEKIPIGRTHKAKLVEKMNRV